MNTRHPRSVFALTAHLTHHIYWKLLGNEGLARRAHIVPYFQEALITYLGHRIVERLAEERPVARKSVEKRQRL